MSYHDNKVQCRYSGGKCSWPDDDCSCSGCSGYRHINCYKCKKSRYESSRGLYCERDGHSIRVVGRVCVYLEPDCHFCKNVREKFSAGFETYECKLDKKNAGDRFNPNIGCDDFVPNETYLEWRENGSKPSC